MSLRNHENELMIKYANIEYNAIVKNGKDVVNFDFAICIKNLIHC